MLTSDVTNKEEQGRNPQQKKSHKTQHEGRHCRTEEAHQDRTLDIFLVFHKMAISAVMQYFLQQILSSARMSTD